MKLRLSALYILLSLGLSISFSSVRAAANQFTSDAGIQREIAWVFETDAFLGDDLFRVRVSNGIVYLNGHVTTIWERARAEELARRVDGVIAVENDLTFSIFREPVPGP